MDKKAAVMGLQVQKLFELWTEALNTVANLTEENAALKELTDKQAEELSDDDETVVPLASAQP